MGSLGPMVRSRALVPVALGRACLLPPNGFVCQARSHVRIPMLPTGSMGNVRLGELPHPGILEPVFGKPIRRRQNACLWTPHTKPSLSMWGYPEEGLALPLLNLWISVLWTTYVIGKIHGHRSSKPVPKEFPPGLRRT